MYPWQFQIYIRIDFFGIYFLFIFIKTLYKSASAANFVFCGKTQICPWFHFHI